MLVDRLSSLLGLMTVPTDYDDYAIAILPYLIDSWLEQYHSITANSEIVEVDCDGFHYLFDVLAERLIAAWCVSAGKHSAPRPKERMKKHPLLNGPLYHRGHAIPHTLGGGTDINLTPQLGSVNIGMFRELEKRAVATPGALYFTHWIYASPDNQTARFVEQGFLYPGQRVNIKKHHN